MFLKIFLTISLAILLNILSTYQNYVRSENIENVPIKTVGIKTFSWQQQFSNGSHIAHNYSKVYHHSNGQQHQNSYFGNVGNSGHNYHDQTPQEEVENFNQSELDDLTRTNNDSTSAGSHIQRVKGYRKTFGETTDGDGFLMHVERLPQQTIQNTKVLQGQISYNKRVENTFERNDDDDEVTTTTEISNKQSGQWHYNGHGQNMYHQKQNNTGQVSQITHQNVFLQNQRSYNNPPTTTESLSFHNQHLYINNNQHSLNNNNQDSDNKKIEDSFTTGETNRQRKVIYVTRQKQKVTPEAHLKCPKSATGQFVYELSCNQFLNCWKGKGWIQNCAAGTLFNPETLECDYADKVQCISGPRLLKLEHDEQNVELVQNGKGCPKQFTGIIPHYGDCSKFINCHNGVEHVMDCPPGTLFDVKTNMCDYPYKTECVYSAYIDAKTTTAHQIEASSQQIDKTICITPSSKHPYPNDCSKFIFCSTKLIPTVYKCPVGKYYNPHLTSCSFDNIQQCQQVDNDYTSRAHQTYNASQYVNVHGTYNFNIISYCTGKNGLQPHPLDCTKYVSCVYGKPMIQSCGPGTMFNPKTNVCDFPHNVKCHTNTTNLNKNKQQQHSIENNLFLQTGYTTNQQVVQFCMGKDGFFAHPMSCNLYIKCFNGAPFILKCSNETNYDPHLNICNKQDDCLRNQNHNKNVGKQTVTTSIQQSIDLTLDASYCYFKSGYYEHPNSCEYYVHCGNQMKILQCGKGKLFHPIAKICDFNVRCWLNNQHNWQSSTENYYVQGVTNIIIYTLQPSWCNNKKGYFLHPLSCEHYIKCENGYGKVYKCDAGKLFNTKYNMCDPYVMCHLSSNYNYQVDGTSSSSDTHNYGKRTSKSLCSQNGIYPHPRSCKHFIQCLNGKSTILKCIDGKSFNPNTRNCVVNYPCNNDNTQDGIFRKICLGKNGLQQHPYSCEHYVKCINGNWNIMKCSAGKLFNSQFKICDTGVICQLSNSNFGNIGSSTGQSVTHTAQSAHTGQSGTYGGHPKPSGIYTGQSGTHTDQSTYTGQSGTYGGQSGTHTDQSTYAGQSGTYGGLPSQSGIYIGQSGTYGGQSGTHTDQSTYTGQSGTYGGQSGAHTDQSTYTGQSGTYGGQSGTHTDQSTYTGQSGTYGGQSGTHTDQSTYIGQSGTYGGQSGTHTDQSKYTGQPGTYGGQSGTHTDQSIYIGQSGTYGGQSGTHTDQSIYTGQPGTYGGQSGTHTDQSTYIGQSGIHSGQSLLKNYITIYPVAKTFCTNKDGLHQHPDTCEYYVKCTNSQPFVLRCNAENNYNPQFKICEKTYICPYKTVVTAEQRFENIQNVKPKCQPHATGLYPHPTDCSKFLNCNNGGTFIQDCGPGTVFNPDLKVCDWPYKVKCGKQSGSNQYTGGQSTHSSNIETNQDNKWNQQGSGSTQWSHSTANHHQHETSGKQEQSGHQHGFNRESSQTTNWNQQSGAEEFGNENNRPHHTHHHHQHHKHFGHSTQENIHESNDNQHHNHHPHHDNHHHQQHSGHSNQDNQHAFGNTHHHRNNNWHQYHNRHHHQQEDEFNINEMGVIETNPEYQIDLNEWNDLDQSQTTHYGFNTNWQHTNNDYLSNVHKLYQQNYNQSLYQEYMNKQNQDQHKYEEKQENFYNNFGKYGQKNQDYEQNYFVGTSNEKWTPTTDLNADYIFEYEDDSMNFDDYGQPINKYDWHDRTTATATMQKKCEEYDYHCTSNECVSSRSICDSKKDCKNGLDEDNCEIVLEEFTRHVNHKLTVTEVIKYENITVEGCAKLCLHANGFVCKSFNYRSVDGMCFLTTSNIGLCGSLIILPNYFYYELKSQMIDCSNKFVCNNKKCINHNQVCDGINDCDDRIDEKNCKAEDIGYQIKLSGSKNKYEGRIEVTVFGKTGYVCDDQFTKKNADVVCKELGYQDGAIEVKKNSYFANDLIGNKNQFLMANIACNGSEDSIRNCDFNGWGIHECKDKEIVGVVCKTKKKGCQEDFWQCDTQKECIPFQFLCDNVPDCTDLSDEGSQHCDAPIEMRLIGGKSKSEGRVEIRYHGSWGTICDDDFNDDAAKVVCKYFGYRGTAQVVKGGKFGDGNGPIWLDQVYCTGNETSVDECSHLKWGENNCEHNEDVGVICSNTYNPIEVERSGKNPNLIDAVEDCIPDQCGIKKDDIFDASSDVQFRVVRGNVARRGDYPWQASLRVKGQNMISHWCGAVVISSHWVLTAAHCLNGYQKSSYIVVAGDYDLNIPEGTEQEAYIEEFYVHAKFRDKTKMNNDIALIKLKGKGFILNSDVMAICLPPNDLDETNTNCTISGYGSIEAGKSGAVAKLRSGWVPIQSREVCKMPHVYGESITEGMLCAGNLNEGVDACDGDSGGPLTCLYNGYYTLYGITSWGQRCGVANKPGVYTKVSHYRKWIEDTMKKYAY